MANMLKKLRKQQRRKRLLREKERLERSQNGHSRRRKSAAERKRESIIRISFVCGLGILILAGIVLFAAKRTYHNYKIVKSSDQEDVVSTQYVEMNGKILRYSPDGVSLVTKNLQTVWNENYSMENPVADVREGAAVIADVDGTSLMIFDKNGKTGSVTTSYSIVKARVSSGGLVAAILDGGDDTWINFYASDGSLIAENQTKIDDPGYPLDIAVSDNGVVMMVAYQFIDGGDTTSYVAFYNFGEVGQNEDDKIVSGYTYDGVIVPQIEYLSGNKSVALRDDGFTSYSGKEIPKEVITVEEENEIISTFYDDDIIGLVFKNEDDDYQYSMSVYSTSGKLKFTKNFNIPYTSIKVSGGNIIMYNSSQINVITSSGTERYSGTVDGTIKNMLKLGFNRYLLVLDNGVSVIKFS
jgi:hypothetical protein